MKVLKKCTQMADSLAAIVLKISIKNIYQMISSFKIWGNQLITRTKKDSKNLKIVK